MKKTERGNNVYYDLAWSPLYEYDKYTALKIVPELGGLISLHQKIGNKYETLIFFGCWRDGCRIGLRKIMDPDITQLPHLMRDIIENEMEIYYRYTVIDSSVKDLQDIMFWLIKSCKPRYNDAANFKDSRRYKDIFVKEIELGPNDVVEKFPGSR
ncbi:MAG: hypothetical protein GY754_23880 [bacterium]|nr:hypothetical protein [bacterium]